MLFSIDFVCCNFTVFIYVLVTQSCLALCDPMDCSLPGFSVRGESPGKNTGVGCHALLQGIFPTQGSNSGLLHCRWILYQLSHKGSPGTLEWVAYPFSRGSSPPRNQTRIFFMAGGFLTSWATREALKSGKERKREVVPCYFHGNKQDFLLQSNHPNKEIPLV